MLTEARDEQNTHANDSQAAGDAHGAQRARSPFGFTTRPASLFDSLPLRGVTARNRVMISPMCQYSCDDRSGRATDWHLVHLGSFATGGAGIVTVEATAVEARGRISPYDVGLWNDDQIEPLARAARFMRGHGSVPAIQLAHAGRKASVDRPWTGGKPVEPGEIGWQVVGPSPIPFNTGYQTPEPLTTEGVHEVVAAFARAAERALAAGFELIELHAAHGYLLHQFLSPASNQRDDEYGGSLENRMRLPLEVARAVRAVWPERLPLFVRVSGTDWLDEDTTRPSWTLDQTVELARRLKDEGVDVIDCSSGGNEAHAHVPVGPGYQTPLAERVRREAGIATVAVGLISDPHQADQIIRSGQADLVALARAALRNPHWPLEAAVALRQPAPVLPQYERAIVK
ncbi:MAG TPA: NADH:flavin oxidoreductase/NADH oxidase [Ktedonobacterales bacterium]|nr:NADH:flavin oxidoreductase/NADH oxidase [Ktedonobacterales bacterium]